MIREILEFAWKQGHPSLDRVRESLARIKKGTNMTMSPEARGRLSASGGSDWGFPESSVFVGEHERMESGGAAGSRERPEEAGISEWAKRRA